MYYLLCGLFSSFFFRAAAQIFARCCGHLCRHVPLVFPTKARKVILAENCVLGQVIVIKRVLPKFLDELPAKTLAHKWVSKPAYER